MKISIRFGLMIALAASASGQTKPKDVDGWGKIKWGMTLAEVRSLYSVPVSTKEWPETAARCLDSPIPSCLPDRGPYIFLDSVEVGDIKMKVTVQAGYKSTKVVSVQLADLNGASGTGNGVRNFDTLKTLLIQKYGTPVNQETKIDDIGAHITTVLWTFTSTSILLTLREQKVIYLEYGATDKKALGVL